MIVAGDVRGHVMQWHVPGHMTHDRHVSCDVTHDTCDTKDVVQPNLIGQMSDAVRGVYLDKSNLFSLSFDANCLMWNIWSQ